MGFDWYDFASVAGMGAIFPTPKTMAVRHLIRHTKACKFFRCEEKTVMMLRSTICESAKLNVCGPPEISEPGEATCQMFEQIRLPKKDKRKLEAEYIKLKSMIASIGQLGLPAKEIAADIHYTLPDVPVCGFVMITGVLAMGCFDMNHYQERMRAYDAGFEKYADYHDRDEFKNAKGDEDDKDDDSEEEEEENKPEGKAAAKS